MTTIWNSNEIIWVGVNNRKSQVSQVLVVFELLQLVTLLGIQTTNLPEWPV